MRIQNPLRSFSASVAILSVAAWLVPKQKREEWLAEWRSELWHVWQLCHQELNPSRRNEGEATTFCLGAFKDALWIRQDDSRSASRRVLQPGSPSRCVLSLAVLVAAFLLIAFSLQSVRKILRPSPYSDADHLVSISQSGGAAAAYPSVRLADYQDWSHSAHHLFTELAFYQPILRRAHFERHVSTELSIARASDNLLQLLNIPISSEGTDTVRGERQARLILSRAAWNKYFHRDPRIFGQVIEIAGEQAVIVGVISEDDWRLPGHIDLWLLDNKQQLSTLPSRTEGYVFARVAPSTFPVDSNGRRRMAVFRGANGYDYFDCISLAEQTRQPLSIFLFTLLLACLALPATTSLPLGEYPAHSARLSWITRFRRWAFLSTKIAGIVAVVYCGSLDLAYCSTTIGTVRSQYIQLATSFLAFLFAFRWALHDQRKRCPVCLRSLTNPARVGQSSQNFLAWSGTELVCLQGHGLLHVPDIPTSWFSTQRWLYLDPSWSALFSGGYLISTGMG